MMVCFFGVKCDSAHEPKCLRKIAEDELSLQLLLRHSPLRNRSRKLRYFGGGQ